MSFDFDALNTAPVRSTDIDHFDHIRDQLPADAPEWRVHQAYVAEICAKFDAYKRKEPLIRAWFGQTAALRVIAEADAVMFHEIVTHFEAALDRLTTELAA